MDGEGAGDAETLVVSVLESAKAVRGRARPKAGRERGEGRGVYRCGPRSEDDGKA